jgi:hypothetical protein
MTVAYDAGLIASPLLTVIYVLLIWHGHAKARYNDYWRTNRVFAVMWYSGQAITGLVYSVAWGYALYNRVATTNPPNLGAQWVLAVTMVQWICFLLVPIVARPKTHAWWWVEVVLRAIVALSAAVLAANVVIDRDRSIMDIAVASTVVHFYTLDFVMHTDITLAI